MYLTSPGSKKREHLSPGKNLASELPASWRLWSHARMTCNDACFEFLSALPTSAIKLFPPECVASKPPKRDAWDTEDSTMKSLGSWHCRPLGLERFNAGKTLN